MNKCLERTLGDEQRRERVGSFVSVVLCLAILGHLSRNFSAMFCAKRPPHQLLHRHSIVVLQRRPMRLRISFCVLFIIFLYRIWFIFRGTAYQYPAWVYRVLLIVIVANFIAAVADHALRVFVYEN